MNAAQVLIPAPLITWSALCRSFSRERIGAYSLESDSDSTDALARYLWNGHLCAAFQPSLHTLEVAFRNAMFVASQGAVNVSGRKLGTTGCWLDVTPSLLYDNEREAVEKAKQRLGADPRFHTADRLVAKLGFGFWTALCQAPYEQGRKRGPQLWPRLLKNVFPHIPRKLTYRATIALRLDEIREFRNRIAHHEPIWDRAVLDHHDKILETIGWFNPRLPIATRACSELEVLFHTGPSQFRAMAAKLLGV